MPAGGAARNSTSRLAPIDEDSARLDSLIFRRVDGKWRLTGLILYVESLKTLDVLRPY